MVPVGMVAEGVAVEARVIEIIQTVEILRRELIVSELVVSELIVGSKRIATSGCEIVAKIMRSELMTAVAHGVTSKWCMRVRPAMSAQCMATPTMTHGGQPTAGSKSMKSTASAPTPMPAATTAPSAMPRDCGGIRDDAKCAHRDACRQNAYRSLLHGTFPTRSSKAVAVAARTTTARISPHPTLNYCGGVTTSWPVT
jgi:hypothetical protein